MSPVKKRTTRKAAKKRALQVIRAMLDAGFLRIFRVGRVLGRLQRVMRVSRLFRRFSLGVKAILVLLIQKVLLTRI